MHEDEYRILRLGEEEEDFEGEIFREAVGRRKERKDCDVRS